uniref:non-specific serine/threonine protein kinase n=1 Tax=Hirondellea gigas TaxID=1518452 RepID=A0A2P2I6B6_9CRUS
MVERYQKVSRIGRGTFGEAWLVTSTCSGRRYVVKEVRVENMTKAEVQKANTEAIILSRCKHNNIVRYKEVFMVANPATLCLVMEYADGGDLASRVRRAKEAGEFLPEETVLKWFVQVIFAVQYLHSNDILHRDLKTQNIFLMKNDLIKVGDFGIARVLMSREDLATTAIGTPYYLSPEICRRLPYNHKSDMWAVGCVLYELCSLNHPFVADTFPDLVLRILRGAYRQLSHQYSSFVRDLVAVLLRTDPNRRPTADQVLMVPLLRPYVTAYLKQHEELISTCSPSASVADSSTPKPSKAAEVVEETVATQAQPAGRGSNLREAILKRLPFSRPRAASDSVLETAGRRSGAEFQPSSVSNGSGSSKDIHTAGTDYGYSPAQNSGNSNLPVDLSEPKQNRIIESEKQEVVQENDNGGSLSFSGTLDSNALSKISSSTSQLSSTNSSTKDSTNKTQNSSCSNCSKLSAEYTGDRKSPMIHVKLYSSSCSDDNSSSGGRRHGHVLCHKVPLSSLSCCAECRTMDNGNVTPCTCLCASQSLGFSMDGGVMSDDKKSTCSSLHSNVVCGCAEEVSCICTKGSQITCEVDLVFEGDNVKNVPMKNEIMEMEVSGSTIISNKTSNKALIDI